MTNFLGFYRLDCDSSISKNADRPPRTRGTLNKAAHANVSMTQINKRQN